MKHKKMAALALGAILVLGVGGTVYGASPEDQAKEYLSQMTKEEKAGQLLMAAPGQLCSDGNWAEHLEEVVQAVENCHIGSIIFLAEDLQNTEAVKSLTDALKQAENGGVLVFADAAGSLSEGLQKPQSEEGLVLGKGELVTGEEAVWAYHLAEAPADGWADLGIQINTAPGTGTDFALVTHEKVKNDMDDGRPASLSRAMVSNMLKVEFDGIVLTDSLSMTAVTESYGADMAVMYALQAGADVLTTPANPVNAYYSVMSAMDEQLVAAEQIDGSVLKLLKKKIELGLLGS